MSKKKPTAFENIRLVGVHKEPTFGPLPGEPKCKLSYKQLQAELGKANKYLVDRNFMSVSEFCSKYNYQDCSMCEKASCGDNTNPIVAENKRLREFARYVIRQECWAISDIDGGDIQELAEKLNLIEPRIATEQDIDDESDYGVGDPMFVFSDALKEVKS